MAHLDIGLPVRNGQKHLARALQSLQGQVFQDFRVLISDSGSTDDTLAIAESVAKTDDRFRVTRHASLTAPQNFLYVLSQSTAEFFIFAAFDDYWSPFYIQRGLNALGHDRPYFVPNWFVGSLGTGRGVTFPRNPLALLSQSDRHFRTLGFINLHHTSHKCNVIYSIFRTSFLRDIVAEVGLDNDGLLGSYVASQAAGVVTDDILFFKENSREARHLLRDRNRRFLTRYGIKILPGEGKSSKAFGASKKQTLELLLRAFPDMERDIRDIFRQYDQHSWHEGFKISAR